MLNTNDVSAKDVKEEINTLDYGVRDVPGAFITISAGFQVNLSQYLNHVVVIIIAKFHSSLFEEENQIRQCMPQSD